MVKTVCQNYIDGIDKFSNVEVLRSMSQAMIQQVAEITVPGFQVYYIPTEWDMP